ncbi:hypothetical protein D3C71_2096860 [compost metagenome]
MASSRARSSSLGSWLRAMTQLRRSGRKAVTASSGISAVRCTPWICKESMYSWRGSQMVTTKPLKIAIVARYSVRVPAPMSSMR